MVAYLAAATAPERIAGLILEEPPPPDPHDMRPASPPGDLPYDWAARQATLDDINRPTRRGGTPCPGSPHPR